MSDPRLENYLATLDRALAPLPVSDRAEIVTEIKSHVLSAIERDPGNSLDSVLTALGEAETVANRYLLERGLKTGKPPISPVVKWVVIGFLGTFAILVAGIVAIILHLSPVIDVNSKEDRVTLFGGLIKVDGENISIRGQHIEGGRSFAGVSEASFAPGQKIGVKFSNGKLDFSMAADGKLAWDCKGSKEIVAKLVPSDLGETLDLTAPAFLKCEIRVPAGVMLAVRGSNGSLEFDRPRFSLDGELANGKVSFQPEKRVRYAYAFSVTNGRTDEVTAEPNPEYKITMRLSNGQIELD